MTIIQVNNISLYYETVGHGKPLLFLHGLGSCGADWLMQIPHFVSSYQVITPDLRGHGKSDKSRGSYTIGELAEDMAKLLEALGIDSCDVVGLSLGSFVALQLALDYPEKVKSLTLAGTTSSIKDIGKFSLAIRKYLLAIFPMWLVAKVIAWSCFPGEANRTFRKMCEARMSANDKQVYKKLYGALMPFDVTDRLSEIKCPVLLISGEKDLMLPPWHAKKMLQFFKNATHEVIPGAGHVMPIESPTTFNTLLERFLNGVKR